VRNIHKQWQYNLVEAETKNAKILVSERDYQILLQWFETFTNSKTETPALGTVGNHSFNKLQIINEVNGVTIN